MNFRIADIYNDAELFMKARDDIEALIDEGYSFEVLGLNNSTGNVL